MEITEACDELGWGKITWRKSVFKTHTQKKER